MIELTVGIPMYRAGDVGWIALESLCRQRDITFDWELLIIEEFTPDAFGQQRVNKYAERLMDVGCQSVCYTSLDGRKILSDKWKMMGAMASESSVAFVLCGADDWNNPLRLKEAHDLISNYGADWVQYETGYYYDLIDRRLIRFDGSRYFRGMSINALVGKSLRTEYMRHLEGDASSKVDTWLMENMLVQNPRCYTILNKSKDGDKAIYTYGANHISARHDEIRNNNPPFYQTDITIESILPFDIIYKLHKIKTREDKDRIGYEVK